MYCSNCLIDFFHEVKGLVIKNYIQVDEVTYYCDERCEEEHQDMLKSVAVKMEE